ncbi:hypothetical protein ACIGXA_04380 [Streptomyces fildesensis]|uniref:Serine/arginine repetitive matrix protein 2 n=1 Tax=Streptomyces fildesensis TaxID=375757 RepID=A0ABW8BZY9_9ACTN
MSHWDADRQQWVRGPQTGQPPEEPYEPPVYPREEPYEPPVYPPPPVYRPATHGTTHDATRYEPVLGPAFGPPPGLPPGPPPGPPQGWSRATVLTAVVASVVLVAGLGFGGWALLRHHDGNKEAQPGSSSPPFDQPSTDGTTDGTTDPGTPSESTTDAPSYSPSTDGPTPAPSGYVRTSDPAGFALDVPEGWQRSTEGDSVFYKTADGNSLIQVFALRGPETTPYESLVATEVTVSKNPGYHRIGLQQLGSGAGDPAQLEYSYVRADGTVRHVVVQAFTDPSTVQYALLVAGPDGDWTAHQEVFRNLLSSFCTTGHCPSGIG